MTPAVIRTPAQRAVLAKLVAAGTWVPRAEIDTLPHTGWALDDALADMVAAGTAEFKQHLGYRLTGGPLVRDAARDIQARPQLRRSIKARVVPDGIALGVATRQPDGELLLYAMALPLPPGVTTDDDALRHAQRVTQSISHHLED